MTGIDFRGRRRFRDSDATERLSALLREDRAAGGSHAARGGEARSYDTEADHCGEREPLSPPEDPSGGSDRPTAASSDPDAHSRHREDVTVRRNLNRPALVLLCVVLLVALGAGCAALLSGGGDQDAVIAFADASPASGANGEGIRGTSDAPGGHSSGGTASGRVGSPAGPPGGPGPSGSAGPSSAGSTGGVLTVHVVGEVRDPSVVTLSPGARVMDAVEAAGGFTPAAVKDRINLAENVADGAQIVIPNRGNVDEVLAARTAPGGGSGGAGAPAPNAASRPAGATNGAPEPGARGGGSTAAAPGAPVNLNTATEAELEALPKVGPVLAQRIVEFRTQHGPFTSPEQLDDVSGVGPAMLEALLPLVTV
ncbi:ComEA family DNA-binding protein [Kocuria tytonicola]|nr:ComEA family DNA-binding protein [Kocuria tytonicola]